MKLPIISRVTMLFSILAPVSSMSTYAIPEPELVPGENELFSFLCPNNRWFDKSFLEEIALIGKQAIENGTKDRGFPARVFALTYDVDGDVWYYPIDENRGEFVVFLRTGRVVGAGYSAATTDDERYLHPCQLQM
ncbi:BgtE-20053, partial [Blumeria graminis f. sp. tritici]